MILPATVQHELTAQAVWQTVSSGSGWDLSVIGMDGAEHQGQSHLFQAQQFTQPVLQAPQLHLGSKEEAENPTACKPYMQLSACCTEWGQGCISLGPKSWD